MMLLITNEARTRATAQLTADQWDLLRPVLLKLRNGPPVVEHVDPIVPEDGPFRVTLDWRSITALEQAAARLAG